MAKQRVGRPNGIVFALWGKTPGELTDVEWDRYRRLTKMASYYKRHEQNKTQQRKEKADNKLDILKELGLPAVCSRCGYDKYIGALEFHHRDPHTKDGKVDSVEEARKCNLLCANCHREVEHERRVLARAGDESWMRIFGGRKSGRPMGMVDPWLTDYMRLAGLNEETITKAHEGRPECGVPNGKDPRAICRERVGHLCEHSWEQRRA